MAKLSDKGRKSLQIQFLNSCKKELEQDKLTVCSVYECTSIKDKMDKIDKELLSLK